MLCVLLCVVSSMVFLVVSIKANPAATTTAAAAVLAPGLQVLLVLVLGHHMSERCSAH
jgi:hypothetical protein